MCVFVCVCAVCMKERKTERKRVNAELRFRRAANAPQCADFSNDFIERERERERVYVVLCICVFMCLCVCVCVCVCEIEKD